jgi:hypothetical protein
MGQKEGVQGINAVKLIHGLQGEAHDFSALGKQGQDTKQVPRHQVEFPPSVG